MRRLAGRVPPGEGEVGADRAGRCSLDQLAAVAPRVGGLDRGRGREPAREQEVEIDRSDVGRSRCARRCAPAGSFGRGDVRAVGRASPTSEGCSICSCVFGGVWNAAASPGRCRVARITYTIAGSDGVRRVELRADERVARRPRRRPGSPGSCRRVGIRRPGAAGRPRPPPGRPRAGRPRLSVP